MHRLGHEVDSLAHADGFSGVVRIDRGDEVDLANAYGLAHRGYEISNTVDTQFAIASGTKGLTAVAVASLIEDGSLALSRGRGSPRRGSKRESSQVIMAARSAAMICEEGAEATGLRPAKDTSSRSAAKRSPRAERRDPTARPRGEQHETQTEEGVPESTRHLGHVPVALRIVERDRAVVPPP